MYGIFTDEIRGLLKNSQTGSRVVSKTLPEMCCVAYACSAIETLRWIAWVGFKLTVFARVSCGEMK
jgi:hypothetical protein